MRADDPRWGCAMEGCDEHPTNPQSGPIFRISAKGTPWVGLCGPHLKEWQESPFDPPGIEMDDGSRPAGAEGLG